jgi:hypothetical protein
MATTVQRLQSLYCGGTWLQNLEDRIGIAGAAQHCASHCGKDSIKPVTPVGQIASVTTRGATIALKNFRRIGYGKLVRIFSGVCLNRRPHLLERLRHELPRERRSAASLWRCCGRDERFIAGTND